MKDGEARRSIETLRILLSSEERQRRDLEARVERLMAYLGLEERYRTSSYIVERPKAEAREKGVGK